MSKFTPGPWRVVPDEREDRGVLDIVGYDILPEDGFQVVGCEGISGDKEGLANAKLIAAAPDLLAALQDVLTRVEDSDSPWWMDNPSRGGMDADMIRDAIAKATGEA